MLVLNRHEGETIVIGDPRDPVLTITVTRIRHTDVRIGVECGKGLDGLEINRGEIAERIIAERGPLLSPGLDGDAMTRRTVRPGHSQRINNSTGANDRPAL